MRSLLIITLLLLCGCGKKPKRVSDYEWCVRLQKAWSIHATKACREIGGSPKVTLGPGTKWNVLCDQIATDNP